MIMKTHLRAIAELLQTKRLTLSTDNGEVRINDVLVTESELSVKDFLFAYCCVTEKELFCTNVETRNLILIGKVVGDTVRYKDQQVNLSYIIEK